MWNVVQYQRFEAERTQPVRDLVARILLDPIHAVIDLGCGPGNSTKVLRDRWPEADITGLDNSPEMIDTARKTQPKGHWLLGDISEWAETGERVDLVFSNAALQWVPNHATLFPRLLARSSGAFAVQMPANFSGPAHELMREMALSPVWRESFPQLPQWHVRKPEFYYDLLAPLSSRLDLWETEYTHMMPDAEAIVEWFKGTGLRPYLDALGSGEDRERFTTEYMVGIRERYKPRPDGRVLFPFRRTFLVAYK
jgi:trans-aconitate 2-methyltransferase